MRKSVFTLSQKLSICVASGLLFAAAEGAAAQDRAGLLVLKLSGDRGWAVSCDFERDGDDAMSRAASGRGDVETIAVDDVVAGSCAYEGPRRGEMQIRFEWDGNEDVCPFTEMADQCIGVVAAGDAGEFSF